MRMLAILNEVDRICRLNKINYWLDAGTLLGAKRHGGFIPWDDDIDICMLRDDYNKFIMACDKQLNKEIFFLQTAYSDEYYVDFNTPCKIRMNNTEIIEKREVKYKYYDERSHHGLFLDIFPYDKYSSNKYIRKYVERFISQLCKLKVLSKYSGFPITKKILIKCLSSIICKRRLLAFVDLVSFRMSERKHDYLLGAGIETPFHRAYFSEDTIFPLSEIKFEGRMYLCPNNVDKYLCMMFGDNYMTIPPAAQRVWHYHSINIGK
ncbi:LicD family protein [Escherichia coli]|nr:LicD family protein [Escherichia coli]